MPATTTKRRPKYKRTSIPNFFIQPRDIEIIYQVHKHRFLTSEHIKALMPGSDQVILRRLHLLYHAGYLDRPREQMQIRPDQSGSAPMVYALGNKGATLLQQKFNIPKGLFDWTTKNREVKTVFLEHTLQIAQFMVCLELALRQSKQHIQIIEPEDILKQTPFKDQKQRQFNYNPFALQVNIQTNTGSLKFSIIPDKVFGLHFTKEPEGKNKTYFFLEADRATMPIMRTNLNRTSYFKKLIGYWSAWQTNTFQTTFNFKNARVLTITTSQERINNMIQANKQVDDRKKGSKMFLFTQTNHLSLSNPQTILQKIWHNGKDDNLLSLLD